MTIERLLQQYPNIMDRIKELNDNIIELTERMKETHNTLKAKVITDMPRSRGEIHSVVEHAVVDLIDVYYEEIQDKKKYIKKLLKEKAEVENLLSLLNRDRLAVVKLRAFDGHKFAAIAEVAKYMDYQTAKIAYDRSLDFLYKNCMLDYVTRN